MRVLLESLAGKETEDAGAHQLNGQRFRDCPAGSASFSSCLSMVS
jgi:hypothetical protein